MYIFRIIEFNKTISICDFAAQIMNSDEFITNILFTCNRALNAFLIIDRLGI